MNSQLLVDVDRQRLTTTIYRWDSSGKKRFQTDS
jgi:hypothetical protein